MDNRASQVTPGDLSVSWSRNTQQTEFDGPMASVAVGTAQSQSFLPDTASASFSQKRVSFNTSSRSASFAEGECGVVSSARARSSLASTLVSSQERSLADEYPLVELLGAAAARRAEAAAAVLTAASDLNSTSGSSQITQAAHRSVRFSGCSSIEDIEAVTAKTWVEDKKRRFSYRHEVKLEQRARDSRSRGSISSDHRGLADAEFNRSLFGLLGLVLIPLLVVEWRFAYVCKERCRRTTILFACTATVFCLCVVGYCKMEADVRVAKQWAKSPELIPPWTKPCDERTSGTSNADIELIPSNWNANVTDS